MTLRHPIAKLGSTLCCSVLQCVAVCCSVLQYIYMCTLHTNIAKLDSTPKPMCCNLLQHVVVCCSVLQCVAVCYSVLQLYVHVTYKHSQTRLHTKANVLQCVAVCCSVLQCVAVCCSVLIYICARYIQT